MIRGSQVVRRLTVNQVIVGSIPTPGAIFLKGITMAKHREYDVTTCICEELEYHSNNRPIPYWTMPSDSMLGQMVIATLEQFGFCSRCGTKVGVVKQKGVYRPYRIVRDDMKGKTFEDFQ